MFGGGLGFCSMSVHGGNCSDGSKEGRGLRQMRERERGGDILSFFQAFFPR